MPGGKVISLDIDIEIGVRIDPPKEEHRATIVTNVEHNNSQPISSEEKHQSSEENYSPNSKSFES